MEYCQENPAGKNRILVLAVGNTLIGDDGAGPACLELLRAEGSLSEAADLVDGGTMGLYLIDRVADYEKVLFLDAASVDEPAGTVIVAQDDEVVETFRTRISPHQAGVNDLLSALALMGKKPRNVALVGVVPEIVDYGMALSETVKAALPKMAETAREVVRGWS